ncbi:MAG: hypothetical protein J7J51_05415 [Candidatus Omnitrophica bacterium]|nr:hypothetical protein [Candidatus Omnitrophota bacterium]
METLEERSNSVDEKIDFVRNEILSKMENLDDKLETAMQIRERLASVEANSKDYPSLPLP